MLHYIIIDWHGEPKRRDDDIALAIERLSRDETPWKVIFKWETGVLLAQGLLSDNSICRFADRNGLVLGSVFKSSDGAFASALKNLDYDDCQHIGSTSGHHLTRNFWGQYIAFFRDSQSGFYRVLRDPSGALPCFRSVSDTQTLHFSRLKDARDLGNLKIERNTSFFERGFLLPRTPRRSTAILGVHQVLPGECGNLGARLDRKFLWDPYEAAESEAGASSGEAAAALERSVIKAVTAMCGSEDSILHNLGGFDSSVLLGCMSYHLPNLNIECINYHANDGLSNELQSVREMIESTKATLREVEYDIEAVDLLSLYKTELPVSPMQNFDCSAPASRLNSAAARFGTRSVTFGIGGDNVFFALRHVVHALDFARVNGESLAYPWIALCAARYGNMSFWSTLWHMLIERNVPHDAWRFVKAMLDPRARWSFLSSDILEAGIVDDEFHPMLLPRDRIGKGKLFHILNCAFQGLEYQDLWDPKADIVNILPLLSQPVIEQCIKIPTWTLATGGIDRGLARISFKEYLPRSIRLRTSKSFPDSLYQNLFAKHRSMITDILLNGEHVRSHYVSKERLEKGLLEYGSPEGISASVALELLNQELWIAACP